MIDREKWGQIYDMARYNGFSPFKFLVEVALREKDLSVDDEEHFFEACQKFSLSRTNYPKETNAT